MKATIERSPKGSRGDQQYRRWVKVWIAMTAPILVYFGLALWLKPVATAENPTLERILMSLAAAYVIASIPAKRWLLAQAEEIDSDLLRQAAIVVPLALCEVAALTGIGLRLVIGSSHYYVFLLLGLAGMLLNFPKKGE
jgi:hypothetical protein